MPGFRAACAAACRDQAAVCRDLHYPHQGGFALELYDADMTLKHAWDSADHWGCSVDATVQAVTLTLPAEPCADCTLRLVRQVCPFASWVPAHVQGGVGSLCGNSRATTQKLYLSIRIFTCDWAR